MIPDVITDGLNSFVATAIDQIMKFIWAAAVALLRTSFEIVDDLLAFGDGSDLVTSSGQPAAGAAFAELWPTLRWIGLSVALGLFLWQLTITMLRGGAGFWRAAAGPFAYGVAVAITLGIVAGLLGAAEGLATLLLQQGLAADNFRTILDNPNLAFGDNPELDSQLDSSVRAMLLGLIGLFGVLPAALGFALQMIFREAAIVVLLATVPITAAGLLTNTTASWFWRSLRWMLAAILMKPALALVLVIGVNMLSAPTGIGGLLAGTGVLLIALFCPLALFRLLAFVEPGTNAGATARASLSRGGGGSPRSGADAGGGAEESNTARFDGAGVGGSGAGSRAAGAGAAGGGAAGGGAAAAGGGAGAAGGGAAAAGGGAAASGGAAGAVGAVNAAVGAAAAFATKFAGETMDATGIGHGPAGGGGRAGRRSGGNGSGGDSSSDGPQPSHPSQDTTPPDTGPPDGGGRPEDYDDGEVPFDWDGVRVGEHRPPDRATPNDGPGGGGGGGGARSGGTGGGGGTGGSGGAGGGGSAGGGGRA